MFVKYRDANDGSIKLRDIKGFSVLPMEGETEAGAIVNGAAIIDEGAVWDAFIRDMTVDTLAGFLLGGDEKVFRLKCGGNGVVSISSGMEDFTDLGWFTSPAAAWGVLDKLCAALARGELFFDLTVYGEDGKEKDHDEVE